MDEKILLINSLNNRKKFKNKNQINYTQYPNNNSIQYNDSTSSQNSKSKPVSKRNSTFKKNFISKETQGIKRRKNTLTE